VTWLLGSCSFIRIAKYSPAGPPPMQVIRMADSLVVGPSYKFLEAQAVDFIASDSAMTNPLPTQVPDMAFLPIARR
jgi:hypothetical protein